MTGIGSPVPSGSSLSQTLGGEVTGPGGGLSAGNGPSPSPSPPAEEGRRTALLALVFCQLITGSTYLVAKIGLQELAPFALGCLRFTLTAAVFLPLLAATGRLRAPAAGDWPLLLRLAAWCIPLNQGLFLVGIRDTYASHGALLYATSPMVVLVMAAWLGRERATVRKAVGVGLGFAGVAVVLLEKGLAFSWSSVRGDAVVFLAVLVWGWYTLDNKAALARYDAVYLTGMAMMLGAVQFLPVGVPALWAQDWTVVTWKGLAAVAYLSLLTSAVSYLIWAWALTRLEMVQVAIVSNLQPIVAAVLGWAVLGEPVTWFFAAGTLLVGTGVFLTQTSGEAPPLTSGLRGG